MFELIELIYALNTAKIDESKVNSPKAKVEYVEKYEDNNLENMIAMAEPSLIDMNAMENTNGMEKMNYKYNSSLINYINENPDSLETYLEKMDNYMTGNFLNFTDVKKIEDKKIQLTYVFQPTDADENPIKFYKPNGKFNNPQDQLKHDGITLGDVLNAICIEDEEMIKNVVSESYGLNKNLLSIYTDSQGRKDVVYKGDYKNNSHFRQNATEIRKKGAILILNKDKIKVTYDLNNDQDKEAIEKLLRKYPNGDGGPKEQPSYIESKINGIPEKEDTIKVKPKSCLGGFNILKSKPTNKGCLTKVDLKKLFERNGQYNIPKIGLQLNSDLAGDYTTGQGGIYGTIPTNLGPIKGIHLGADLGYRNLNTSEILEQSADTTNQNIFLGYDANWNEVYGQLVNTSEFTRTRNDRNKFTISPELGIVIPITKNIGIIPYTQISNDFVNYDVNDQTYSTTSKIDQNGNTLEHKVDVNTTTLDSKSTQIKPYNNRFIAGGKLYVGPIVADAKYSQDKGWTFSGGLYIPFNAGGKK